MHMPLLVSAHQPQPACEVHDALDMQWQSPAPQPLGQLGGFVRPSAWLRLGFGFGFG